MKLLTAPLNYFGLTYLATGKETNGQYFLSKTIVPAGDPGPPPHIHTNEDEGFYLESGNLIFTINGEEFELGPGSYINIEKGEKHTWRNDTSTDAILMVTFAPAGIEDMFREMDANPSNLMEIGLKYGTQFFIEN